MNRDNLLTKIDEMSIREKDYDTIDFLLKNTTPRLFTKIFEEIFLGNLYISDFESFLTEEQRQKYNTVIETQYKLEKYMTNLSAFRHRFAANAVDAANNRILNPTNNIYEAETNVDATSFVKDNIVSELFETGVNDDSITKEIKIMLYNKIYKDANLKNALLTSNGNFIIPMTYTKVLLDDYDIQYMHENNISEENMKKMKAMMLYLENKESEAE